MEPIAGLDATSAAFLKHIATTRLLTRKDLSRLSGLTKTTVSGVVSALINDGYVGEYPDAADSPDYSGVGRRPVYLALSEESPLICGMLVRRGCLSVTLSGLDGKIRERSDYACDRISADGIADILCNMFVSLKKRTGRKILAIGLSCLGPIDLSRRMILAPTGFYGISNFAIADVLEARTGLKVVMQNDINAGAVAESLYGGGRACKSFLYLHIMNGIGVGAVLDSRLYEGESGNGGDIAHMTVNMFGERCPCGNNGCLEMYANLEKINEHMRLFSMEPDASGETLGWNEVMRLLGEDDPAARSAMQEYCSVLSYALSGILRCLDVSRVVFGYEGCGHKDTLERLLESNLRQRMQNSGNDRVSVSKSAFFADAPLIGAAAIVAERVFDGK